MVERYGYRRAGEKIDIFRLALLLHRD
jgi:hypothetical protein